MPWGSKSRNLLDPIPVRLGGQSFDVGVRVSTKARRIRLRVSESGAEVVLPRWARRQDAQQAVASNQAWLAKHVARLDSRAGLAPRQDIVMIEGVDYRIVCDLGDKPVVLVEGTTVHLGGGDPLMTLTDWLKNLARIRILAALEARSQEMGLFPTRVSLRDQKTKWGACTSRGTVTFNWRLIMAPPEVLDYVVVHELAHLKELNHSPRFWAVVERYCPKWRIHRKWLTHNGHRLRLHEA